MWLLENFICVLTFLLESSILKILEYWKRLTLEVQEMLPLLKKLTFPRKYPTNIVLPPTSPATLLSNFKLKASALKQLQANHALEFQNYSRLYREDSNFCQLLPLESIQVLVKLFVLLCLFNCSDWQKQIIEKLAKRSKRGKVVISPTFTANRYVVTNYGIQQPWPDFFLFVIPPRKATGFGEETAWCPEI